MCVCSKQKESHDREMWRSIAMSLKLKREQIASALKLREQHLARLEKIFIERQPLNLEAIQHLVPSNHILQRIVMWQCAVTL